MHLTWLDSNSWLIEIAGKRILLDPWLVGALTFNNLDWLFKGTRPQERPIPENIDLILLSQGLEDHTHPPTLQQMDRQIPVVASLSAAKVVQKLGYTSVTALNHGETFTLHHQIEIKATTGMFAGPNTVENGYLLKDLVTGLSLYYDPHGTHDPQIQQAAPVDVVITPLIDLVLPLVGPIIKGTNKALEVAKWLKPQVMLPTAAGGDVIFAGLINKLLTTAGSVEEFRASLAKNNLSTQVIEPLPGDRIQLQLSSDHILN
jgi:L-ascorbate metabolism protein UlaG (beta-lactamase superfamily)